MISDGLFGAIGRTPMVRLRKVIPGLRATLGAKLEFCNPGGSAKDRPAFEMIQRAFATGAVTPATTVIESSSGNMAIGLAQACAYHGLRLLCVVDRKTNVHVMEMLHAFGARTVLIEEPDAETGEYQPARIACVRRLLEEIPDSFWPNQYENEWNPHAHRATMHEIREVVERVDYLFCATSTCGTICGCANYIIEHGMQTKICAVDAEGSTIFGGRRKKRLLSGHGGVIRPKYLDGMRFHQIVRVSERECVLGCRRLVAREGLLAGASSGGVIAAVEKIERELEVGMNCVVILHDRGERYLSTVYNDAWIREHFGDLLKEV